MNRVRGHCLLFRYCTRTDDYELHTSVAGRCGVTVCRIQERRSAMIHCVAADQVHNLSLDVNGPKPEEDTQAFCIILSLFIITC